MAFANDILCVMPDPRGESSIHPKHFIHTGSDYEWPNWGWKKSEPKTYMGSFAL